MTVEINDSEQRNEKISVEKASALLESGMIIFLDLRSADNFHSAHIPGAFNFPFENIYEQLSELEKLLNNKNSVIIIYGSDLMDTKPDDLAELIGMMGYENIKIMTGGWASWVSKNFPVTTRQNSGE
ncbi:MAG: rhodanese-like domain-containing protein [Desulfobacterales bacterium]|nr:rhodanese-like domain-containing protein [Desulfobacterales bacterium]